MSKLRRWSRRLVHSSQLSSNRESTGGGLLNKAVDHSEDDEKTSEDQGSFCRPGFWTPEPERDARRAQREVVGQSSVLVLVIGPPGVGKRSLYRKLMYDDDRVNSSRHAASTYDPTLEDDPLPMYRYRRWRYGLDIKHSLFTPGKVELRSTHHDHYAIILTYDLSSLDSWNEAVRLQKLISSTRHGGHGSQLHNASPLVMLLGLKADVHGDGWPPLSQRERFAQQHGSLFAECSARTGQGVHEAMIALVRRAHEDSRRDLEAYARGMNHELWEAAHRAVRSIRTFSGPGHRPEVYRDERWLDMVQEHEVRDGVLDHRGGTICVALWAASGVKTTSLLDKLSSNDTSSGREQSKAHKGRTPENRSASYVCGSCRYDVGIIESPRQRYLSDYHGVVLAYNVHERETWEEVEDLLARIRGASWGEGGIPVPIIVLGIESDSDTATQEAAGRVPRVEAESTARRHGCCYFECSQQTGAGVDEAFGHFVQEAHILRLTFASDAAGLEHSKDMAMKVFDRILSWSYVTERGVVSPFEERRWI